EVLIRWMDRIERGLCPVIFGDGQQTMDFVYVEDIARANLLAAMSAASGEVFNIGSGVETSLSDLAQTLLAEMQANLPGEHGEERGLAETSRARARLGFERRVHLEEGLRRLVAWWRRGAARPAPMAAMPGAGQS